MTLAPFRRVEVWGVLNVTPDSFSDGGEYLDPDAAAERAQEMLEEGADVIDIGGESTRPRGATYGEGAREVDAGTEIARVIPVIERVAAMGSRISVDTTKADVARAALRAGASIINDVSGKPSDELLAVAADSAAILVVMHNRGRGEVEAPNTTYPNVVDDVRRELEVQIDRAERAGIPRDRLWIDPGFGFAKTAEQSAELLARLPMLVDAGRPVLVGASRKSFLAAVTKRSPAEMPPPARRLGASIAAVVIAASRGAAAVRVHDVAESRQAVDLVASMATFADSGL